MAQNMMVTAHALGLASCPVTFHHEDCIRDLLGFPSDHDAQMGVGVGHPGPAGEKKESAPRIPLDELVDWGRWKA
jgi:nitroreductase